MMPTGFDASNPAGSPNGRDVTVATESRRFRPLLAVAVVVVVSILISRWAVWYGTEVSIPRYCAAPEDTLETLRAVVSDAQPADGDSRRAAMVAAKLLFLVPRESGETNRAYLERVRERLELQCR